MTRITLTELKNAARDPAKRHDPTGSGPPFPTPMPTATSAVRRYHREGAAAATVELNRTFDRSSHWGPTGPGPAQGWANAIRTCLDRYIDLAGADPRPSLGAPIAVDVDVGANSVGVSIEVVLIDPAGYVGRLILWDRPPLTQDLAELLSGPAVLALQNELGEDRVAGIEVWHLRDGTQFFVDAATATARLAEADRVVRTYVS